MKHANLKSRTNIAAGLRRLRLVVIAVAGITLGALAPLPPTPAGAADLKLEAPCDALETLDVTSIDNPNCKPVSAIYIGADGKMLYVEPIQLDGDELVSGRLVRVLKACREGDQNCAAGCGSPGCFVCIGGRCGCLC
jgi:hypothetical protein